MAEPLDISQRVVDLCRALPREAAIVEFAQAQHGVITTGQLAAFGLGKAAVARRASDGRLFRVHIGVYAIGRPDLTTSGRLMAAVLACRSGAVLSHRSAAVQHGLLLGGGTLIDVTRPAPAGRPRSNIRIHSSTTLTTPDTTTVDAIPCTSIARTLVDLGDREPPRVVERALDQAETHGVFDLAAIEDVLRRVGPRRATGVLRRLLAELGEPTLTDRELEELFLALIRQAGFPAPAVNAWITGDGWAYKADFLWRAERLVVETDSRAFHGDRRAFEHDRLRDQRLTLAGFTVVRFTWRQLVREPERVRGVVHDLLARLAHP